MLTEGNHPSKPNYRVRKPLGVTQEEIKQPANE